MPCHKFNSARRHEMIPGRPTTRWIRYRVYKLDQSSERKPCSRYLRRFLELAPNLSLGGEILRCFFAKAKCGFLFGSNAYTYGVAFLY